MKTSRRRSRQDDRVGTLAFYGPNATLATKMVASVSGGPGDRGPMSTWLTDMGDVRNDRAARAETLAFFAQHGVTRTVMSDGIIGCPHQEGIDYPLGRVCPQCPFWANIDRFTHQPIAQPVATMTPDEVLAALSVVGTTQPLEALASADAHRAALVGPLLAVLERVISDPKGISQADCDLFAHALYLLAKWRENRALPLVCRWLSLPGEEAFDIAGDVVTQDGARILACVCDGNLEPLTALAVNRAPDEFCRANGIDALGLLAIWAEVPREPVIERLRWLAQTGLEREPSYVWAALANTSADLEAIELFPEIRQAFDDGWIDERCIGRSELDEVEAGPRGTTIEEVRDRRGPIMDVAEATSWWPEFQPTRRRDAGDQAPPKVGRNDPCPCGSGKKYKKCHGAV